jgi:hypothetical protein
MLSGFFTMAEARPWHVHLNSDETFLVIKDCLLSNSKADLAS